MPASPSALPSSASFVQIDPVTDQANVCIVLNEHQQCHGLVNLAGVHNRPARTAHRLLNAREFDAMAYDSDTLDALDPCATYFRFESPSDSAYGSHTSTTVSESDALEIDSLLSRHAKETAAQNSTPFKRFRERIVQITSWMGRRGSRDLGVSTDPVTLLAYRPKLSSLALEQNTLRLSSTFSHARDTVLRRSDAVASHLSNLSQVSLPSTSSDAPISSAASPHRSGDRASQISDDLHGSRSCDSTSMSGADDNDSTDLSFALDDASDASSIGSALDMSDAAKTSTRQIVSSRLAMDRNRQLVIDTAEHAATTNEPITGQFIIGAQGEFFISLLKPANRALVDNYRGNNFDSGFQYLMPMLCTLADDFGVERDAIAEQANHFANYAFRPGGDNRLGIEKPDLRNAYEKKLGLSKVHAARRVPDHLQAATVVMALIAKKIDAQQPEFGIDPSQGQRDALDTPLQTLTDRLTFALVLVQRKFLAAVAAHGQEADIGQLPPLDATDINAEARKIKRLIPFTSGGRRSVLAVMQERAKLINDTIDVASGHVARQTLSPHRSENSLSDDAGSAFGHTSNNDIDRGDALSDTSRLMPSSMLAHTQYAIPGWTFRVKRDEQIDSDTRDVNGLSSGMDTQLSTHSGAIDELADEDSPDGRRVSELIRQRRNGLHATSAQRGAAYGL